MPIFLQGKCRVAMCGLRCFAEPQCSLLYDEITSVGTVAKL